MLDRVLDTLARVYMFAYWLVHWPLLDLLEVLMEELMAKLTAADAKMDEVAKDVTDLVAILNNLPPNEDLGPAKDLADRILLKLGAADDEAETVPGVGDPEI